MRFLVISGDSVVTETPSLAFQVGWPGMEVIASDGAQGISLIKKGKPAVVAVDLDITSTYGFDLIRDIRKLSDVPVIVLASRYVETEVVRATWLGADAYMSKPLGMLGIVARVWAMLKRQSGDSKASKQNIETRREMPQVSFTRGSFEHVGHLVLAS